MFKKLTFLVLLITAAAFAQTITAPPATLVVTAPSTGGALLTGATVSATNVPSVGTPAGWVLRRAEGFDSGTLFPGDDINERNALTTTNPHTGSRSVQGLYDSDATIVAYYAHNLPASFSEIYLSFWDYVDPNGLYANSDYFMFDFISDQGQDAPLDAQYYGPVAASTRTTTFTIAPQGANTADVTRMGYYFNQSYQALTINAGNWRQYEVRYKPSTVVTNSTCITSPAPDYTAELCSGNGEMDIWINGAKFYTLRNADINGTANMASGLFIEVGGTITSFASNNTDGDVANMGRCDGPNGFLTCPGPAPGLGAPTAYHRYIDDVIVLTK